MLVPVAVGGSALALVVSLRFLDGGRLGEKRLLVPVAVGGSALALVVSLAFNSF